MSPSFTPPLLSSPTSAAQLSYLSSLLDSRQPGHSLPSSFYLDPLTHAYDLRYMWSRSWLFAGYSCQLPRAGDYFTYDGIGNDSIIIIRSKGEQGEEGSTIRAFHNSCRHRGSRIVASTKGETKHTKRLVCPYHQWSYDREGNLLHARDMDPSFDKTLNGLHEVHAEEVAGLIFISLTPKHERPLFDFAPARALIEPQLRPHQLGSRAKIAHSANYVINANWKLVYENNRECYHVNKREGGRRSGVGDCEKEADGLGGIKGSLNTRSSF